MSDNDSIQTCQVHTSFVKDVLNLENELCSCKAKQFVISRGNIKNVIDKKLEIRHCILYALGEIARGVILRCHVCDNNRLFLPEALDVRLSLVKISHSYALSTQVTIALFDGNNRDLCGKFKQFK